MQEVPEVSEDSILAPVVYRNAMIGSDVNRRE